MNIDITPIDFITETQKKRISKAMFDKYMEAISNVEIKPVKLSIDISKEINEDINAMFSNGDVFDHLDTKKIGKAISDKILEGLA